MMNEKKSAPIPLLSIVCITYNHEAFIGRAFEGFLMQKTKFNYEIIIGEDHSTDKTKDIINEYIRRFPYKIKLISSSHNEGAVANERKAMLLAKGKYIAFCEGDDYWTDHLKLQKQVDFLEQNSEYSVCFHRWKRYDTETNTWSNDDCEQLFKSEDNTGVDITIKMFLNSWITQPLTMVYRRDHFDLDIALRYKYYRDNHLIYHLLQKGKGYLFGFEGGVYNIHSDGIYSKKDLKTQCELNINIARDLYLKNKKDILLKLNFLKSLQFNIVRLAKNKLDYKTMVSNMLEQLYYSLSLKIFLKNTILFFKNYI